jgi:ribonuclease HI
MKRNYAGDLKVEAEIYSDGASSGNPGHAGIGVVIRLMDRPLENHSISEYIGIATNNVAEYSALQRGLEKAHTLGLKKIAVFLDSELLVKQLQGEYRVKSKTLLPFWEETRRLLQKFEHYTITHLRRELNKEADLLAKKAVSRVSIS